jgi:hypothetical protein
MEELNILFCLQLTESSEKETIVIKRGSEIQNGDIAKVIKDKEKHI